VFKIKKVFAISIGVLALGSIAQASMLEQLIYNVAGQVTNATGARLGDEIYYGSSRHKTHKTHRKHKKYKKHKKRHVAVPKMTNEKRIQQTLTSLGFYHGRMDGEINSFETRTAIKNMNMAYGISNDASLRQEVRDTLIYLGTLFEFDRYLIAANSTNKAKNKKVQVALKIHGYYHNGIDGALGKGSRNAIREYQMGAGLPATGALDYEAEYQLISSAKDKNDKNLNESINSLKSFGMHRPTQQPYQQQPYQQQVNQQQIPVQQRYQQQAPVQQQQRYQQQPPVQQMQGYQQPVVKQLNYNKVQPSSVQPLAKPAQVIATPVEVNTAVKVAKPQSVQQKVTPTIDTSIPDTATTEMYTNKK